VSASQNLQDVKVYQLKVTLRHIGPMIWRRLLVTSDTSISQMHSILQVAMGWEDLHLHRFRIHGKAYGIYREGGISFADNPHQVKLRDFGLRKGEQFFYEYDMGDFWEHDIRLELVLPLEPERRYPRCIDGAGDCPAEDCGGPEGFIGLMEERCSWDHLLVYRKDIVMIAERLLSFFNGGPPPTWEETEFVDAVERLGQHLDGAPIEFKRREVNAALCKLAKEWTCTSEFR
jgi:hypothetical protein